MDKLAKALQKQAAGKSGKGGVLDKIEQLGFTKFSEEKSAGATKLNARNTDESDRRNEKYAAEEEAKPKAKVEASVVPEMESGDTEAADDKKKKDFADKLNKSKWWE